MPRAVLKLPNPAKKTITIPIEITRYPKVTKFRSLLDCQSATNVLNPLNTYQSNSKLTAAIIKNILKKPPLCISCNLILQFIKGKVIGMKKFWQKAMWVTRLGELLLWDIKNSILVQATFR